MNAAARLLLAVIAGVSPPIIALAEDAAAEIEYLIDAVDDSNCEFLRNGRRYEADRAAEHLRLKYRRAPRHAKTAEQFIERLASRSSLSGRAYAIDCPGADSVPAGEWLEDRLQTFRAATATPGAGS